MLSKPLACQGCPLETAGMGFSVPEGLGVNGVLIVGEALGDHERRDGLPFRPDAPAGSVLERAFQQRVEGIKLDRQQFKVWNCCGCQPPRNWLEGAPWEQGAIRHCKVHFDKVVQEMQPKVFLALGGVALRTLTGMAGEKQGITSLRGFVLKALPEYGGIPVIGTYHPSFIRRGSGKGRDEDTGAKTGGGAGKGGMHLLGVFFHDIRMAVQVAAHGFGYEEPRYSTNPSVGHAESFLRWLKDNPQAMVAYDLETMSSAHIEEDEIEDLGGAISQIQFSVAAKTGICFPWEEPFIGIAKEILATQNPKIGHNVWKFDNPILRAAGAPVNGLVHDSMEMWRRWQPDLPAGLQFVASLCGFPFPWKHYASTNPEWYGCADVDAPHWIWAVVPEWMKRRGVWRSYEEHVLGLDPILVNMTGRGINVDDTARQEFGVELDKEAGEIAVEIQALVPEPVKPIHPKEGYKKTPKDAVEGGVTEHAGEPAVWREREVSVLDKELKLVGAKRWFKILPFNPNSSNQIKDYISFRREEEIQKFLGRGLSKKRAEELAKHKVPKDLKTEKDTTAKLELKKLHKATGDPFYKKVVEVKEVLKLKSTYVEGWKPGPDGKVHPRFGHGTGTGQLTSAGPNAQNAPKIGHGGGASERFKKRALRFRSIIHAGVERKLVEFDFKSAHALTLGFEAQDPDYMRIARIDMHSFLAAAGILRLEDPAKLLALPDAELKAKLKWYRKNWKDKTGTSFEDIRNIRAKPAILGYGFAMGPRTLYTNNPESYVSVADAATVIRMLDRLFPRQPKFREMIRRKAAMQTYLVSRHGYIRWFFDVAGADAEACIAFLPANDAFGTIKDKMRKLEELGWNEQAHLINQIHDSLIYDMPVKLIDVAVPEIKRIMELPDPLLVDPVVAPEGLWIEVDVAIGNPWSRMEEVSVKTGWSYQEKEAA